MEDEDDNIRASKVTCIFMLLVFIGGVISFFANFWYIFVPIIAIVIYFYKKIKK